MKIKRAKLSPQMSKGGFTLIELLIVMVIIAILAGVIVMAVGGVFGTARSSAYATAREQIQNAVVAYESATSGALPVFTGTGTCAILTGNGSVGVMCVNFSALVVTTNPIAGTLRQVPDGTYGSGSLTGTDNCANATLLAGCRATSHYIWYIDNSSTLYSKCTNAGGDTNPGCTAPNTTSGYQGDWP